MQQINITCASCKETFVLIGSGARGSNGVLIKENFLLKGNNATITYYLCPLCLEVTFVQIDNSSTIDELAKYKRNLKRLMRVRQRGEDVPKKLSAKLKKSHKHLSDSRIELMKLYTGESVEIDGKTYELRFSV